jgi:GNAT superfamily N-acetyltransferase
MTETPNLKLQLALKRAKTLFREEGGKGLWFKILGETVYRRLLLLERHLDSPLAEAPPRVPVVMNLLKTTEIDDYAGFRTDTDRAEVHRRLESNHWCFVARYQGRIVNTLWATRRRAWIDYLSCEIQLSSDAVYIYDSFTSPQFRGNNIAPSQENRVVRYFRDAGCRHILVAVLPENKPGMRALEKAGFRPFRLIGYVTILYWRWNFLKIVHRSHNKHKNIFLQITPHQKKN